MEQAVLIVSQIYEAALDDEQFTALPLVLAHHFHARSAVIHWLDSSRRSEVDATSGYYSASQMRTYTENFAANDLWTVAAARDACRNTAWNANDLVAEDDYAKSTFYNDWIRPMGDDTWRCAGAVMETSRGFGIIGIHRGRSQPDFGNEVVDRLQEALPHLRRALAMRGKLQAYGSALESWNQIFEAGRSATFIIDALGRVRRLNEAAERLLEQGNLLELRDRRIVPCCSQQAKRWSQMVCCATDQVSPSAGEAAFGQTVETVWTAEALPIVAGDLAGCALVTIAHWQDATQSGAKGGRLREIYGLTEAEAAIATLITEGQSLTEIAGARGTTRETIRSQLKHILAKTGTRRQAELVSLAMKVGNG